MIRRPQIPRVALYSIAKVDIVDEPIAKFVSVGKFMFDELESVGEEEGEGSDDGGASLVEAAGGVAGYVED